MPQAPGNRKPQAGHVLFEEGFKRNCSTDCLGEWGRKYYTI